MLSARFGRTRRLGFATVLEVLLAAGVLGLLLIITAGLYGHGLDRVKSRQAAALMASLDRSIRAYGQVCEAYPPGSPDGGLRRVLPQLLAVEASKRELSDVPAVLLFTVDGRPHCQDPWGTPIRCFTKRVREPQFLARVERNSGVPVFESAGPDRDFGDNDAARQADNLRSDEPLDLPAPIATDRTPPESTPRREGRAFD